MLRNYLLVAVRNLRKQKGYAAINVVGLAAGSAVSLLILLYVHSVLTFDRFHEHADDLYFLYRTRPAEAGELKVYDSWAPVLPELQRAFPAVAGGVRLMPGSTQWVRRGDRRFEERVDYADSTLFTVFSLPLLRGDPETVLARRESVVISEEMARKYFGSEDPVGRTLGVNFRERTVTGVMREAPVNSSFRFDFVAPIESVPLIREYGWDASFLFTFVLLEEGADPRALEAQLPAFVERHVRPEERGDFRLLPLADFDEEFNGRRTYAYALLAIALSILAIAAINFTNLATARALLRRPEIGMRKVLGATRGRLVAQFLGEAMVVSFLALLAGVALAELLLPRFNEFVGLELTLGVPGRPELLLALAGLGLAIGVLAGAYPALFLSRFRPIAVLRDAPGRGSGGTRVRNGLVVVQFGLAVVLVVGLAAMHRQLSYLKTLDLRFEAENVLVVPVSARDFEDEEEGRGRLAVFKNALAGLSGVVAVSASNGVPGRYPGSYTLLRPEGQRDRQPLDWRFARVDDRFFDAYGLEFVEGRAFSKEFGTDLEEGIILNEAAVRAIGWDRAVGRKLFFGERARTVVGVVRDFHYQSLQNRIEPVLHLYAPEESAAHRFVSVRLDQRGAPATIARIREAWQALDPTRSFEYAFADERFDEAYETEENLARMVTAAALLALLIACLGLLGLASYTVIQRTKEIGIRKVLGATVPDITFLLARQFCRPVLLAVVLAAPVAYWLVNRYLEAFPYRIAVGLGLLLPAGALVLAVALVTVSYQSVRAASADPVESLRYE